VTLGCPQIVRKRFVQNIPYQLVVAQATPNSLGITRKISHCTVHAWDDDIIATWTVSGPKEVCECTHCNRLQTVIHPVIWIRPLFSSWEYIPPAVRTRKRVMMQ
jgi:hypothetical protein